MQVNDEVVLQGDITLDSDVIIIFLNFILELTEQVFYRRMMEKWLSLSIYH